jgi:hypothetical protein
VTLVVLLHDSIAHVDFSNHCTAVSVVASLPIVVVAVVVYNIGRTIRIESS